MGSKVKHSISQLVLPWTLLLLSQCLTASPRDRYSAIISAKNSMATATASNTTHSSDIHIRWRDEVSLRLRNDGLREFRIAFRGVLVLETTSSFKSTSSDSLQHTVRLLQVTDGRQLVHTVMEGKIIKDCRLSTESADVLDFIDEYLHGAPRRPRRGDVLGLYDDTLATYVTSNTTRSTKRSRRRRRKRNPLFRGISMDVMRPDSLGRFSRYLRVARQVRECQRFQSRMRQYLGESDSGKNGTRTVPGRAGSASSSSRRKRDLMTGWFIFPGTKWCGSGDIAEHENDLGYDEALDTCCRDHDLCPHIIPRFTWRFGFFNFHLHTLSHCRCDKRFRRCLKKSTSPAAHMVGKIFFNVVGSQCFKFTKERTCKRRNWWGRCKRYGFTKVAHPRKQRAF